MFNAFNGRFYEREDAIDYAMKYLAAKGEMVEMSFKNVPNIDCEACGAQLFDFQKANDKQIGESGDDIECHYDLTEGFVCKECARLIAIREVEEVETEYRRQMFRVVRGGVA